MKGIFFSKFLSLTASSLITTSLLTFSIHGLAQGHTVVRLTKMGPNRYIPISSRFESMPVKFFISGSLGHLVMAIHGRAYIRDAAPYVRRALHLWQVIANDPQRLRFEEVSGEGLGSADIVFRASEDQPMGGPSVVTYNLLGSSTQREFIVLVPSRLSQSLQETSHHFPDTPIDDYINNTLAATLFHATGHTLGLLHPPYVSDHSDINPVREGINLRVNGLSLQQQGHPSIMEATPFEYLLQLQDYLHGRVRLDEVLPSYAETEAIKYILEGIGPCGAASSSASNISLFHASLSQISLSCYDPALAAWPATNILLLN